MTLIRKRKWMNIRRPQRRRMCGKRRRETQRQVGSLFTGLLITVSREVEIAPRYIVSAAHRGTDFIPPQPPLSPWEPAGSQNPGACVIGWFRSCLAQKSKTHDAHGVKSWLVTRHAEECMLNTHCYTHFQVSKLNIYVCVVPWDIT